MDHAWPSSTSVYASHPQRFLVFNLQATFLLGFLLNFASGLLWQRSGHPILLVAQELKLSSGESKTFQKSSDVVRFDLRPLLQDQTRIAIFKSTYNSLIIGPRGLQCENSG